MGHARCLGCAWGVCLAQIGAVLVGANGSVLARTHNVVEQRRDPTAHAELVAVREAALAAGSWRLAGATLYCTLEPCAMCLSALQAARIGRVVYSAPDLRLGAVASFHALLDKRHPFHPDMVVESGLLANTSAELLRTFFRDKRQGGKTALGSFHALTTGRVNATVVEAPALAPAAGHAPLPWATAGATGAPDAAVELHRTAMCCRRGP